LQLAVPIGLLAAGAALLSGLIALAERDLRRLVSQLMFLSAASATPALVVGTARGITAGVTHIVVAGATAAVLFIVIEAIERRYEARDSIALSGLSASAPLLATLAALGLVGLVGVPGVCAGGSSWLVMSAIVSAPALHDGSLLALWLVVSLAVSHALAAVGVFAVLRRLFSPPTARARRDVVRVSFGQGARLLFCIALAVGSGILNTHAMARMSNPARDVAAAVEAAP
jgi:formate hydrogenlyase subunit 3/multisubunit Na+/H+ antiporter MnhD subunit